MDKYEFLMIIAVIIALVVIWIQISPIFGEESLRYQVTQLNKQYGQADDKVVKYRNEIGNYKGQLAQAEQELVSLKEQSKTSWDVIPKIKPTETKIESIKLVIEKSETHLRFALDEKEQIFNKRNELQAKVDDANKKETERNAEKIKTYVKKVGVRLSNNCITMIKNNITSDCPTYEELAQLDNSVQDISGKFEFSDGYYHRSPSVYKSSWDWYRYDNELRLFIDPPQEYQPRMKMITIESNFGFFIEAPEDNKLHDNTITLHRHRDINECRTAQIDASNWKELLPDTVHYFRTNCTVTNFDNKYVEVREDTYWDYEDCLWCKYREWLEEVKKLCIGLC